MPRRNGHCHISCLITAKKASSNALEPLTRYWLKCNQCQALYADPTKRELYRAMNGGQWVAKRMLSTFINLLWKFPGLMWRYTILTLYVALLVVIYLIIIGSIILLFPSAKRLYRTSAVETRLICTVVILAISSCYRHRLLSHFRWLARNIIQRIGREIYFNFWFAAEGIGANGLSIASKICAFAALAVLGCLRIKQRGTFDYPFHGVRPRIDRAESPFRKASRFVSFSMQARWDFGHCLTLTTPHMLYYFLRAGPHIFGLLHPQCSVLRKRCLANLTISSNCFKS